MLARERPSRVLSLDDIATLEAAQHDPHGFVQQFPDGTLVIDELQRAPELVLALKAEVDRDRRPGRFLVTGSANLLHVPGVSDSLAGRAETIRLFGLSQGEMRYHREDFVQQIAHAGVQALAGFTTKWQRQDYASAVTRGGFPEALGRFERRRSAWFGSYVRRLVERDVENISRLRHADRLNRIVQLIAANNAGELNMAKLARDANIPQSSIDSHLLVLKHLFLTSELPAWGFDLVKRVISRPKLAIADSGLAAHLVGVTAAATARVPGSQHFGGLLVGFVVSELKKQQTWSHERFSLFHFRDREGREVDIIIELPDGRVIGIEVKAGVTVRPGDFRGLEFIRDKVGSAFIAGFVLHAGERIQSFGDQLFSAPISLLWHDPKEVASVPAEIPAVLLRQARE